MLDELCFLHYGKRMFSPFEAGMSEFLHYKVIVLLRLPEFRSLQGLCLHVLLQGVPGPFAHSHVSHI